MDKYIEIIKARLDQERFRHSLGVAKTAQELAERNGVDTETAFLAGILHDYGKNIEPKELIKIAEKQRLIIDIVEKENPFLLHGPVGAYLIEVELGVSDPQIFEAVYYHTTGKPNMGKLAQIIYIADLIEPNRKFPQVEELRQLTYENLSEGLLTGLTWTLQYLLEKKQPIHLLSVQTRNWLLNR